MRLLTTDCLYTGQGGLAFQAWLRLDAAGKLVDWGTGSPPATPDRHIKGLVFGGLVNAHCHLELSHLKGCIPEGTGMAGFVRVLQKVRSSFSEEDVKLAALTAAQRMWANGIAAVGDICNTRLSLDAKRAVPALTFHNFIEVFGMDPARAESNFMGALDLAEEMGPRSSITLHAPYSVSIHLRDTVQSYARTREWPQSIHLLESAEERQLFEGLDGPLMQMLRDFGVPFQGHTAKSPHEYILPGQPPECPTMLVHVTQITAGEVAATQVQLGGNAFFVLCPNANRFIHGTLPPARMLLDAGAQVCVGTDSLAGNHDLDMWSELRTLQESFGLETGTLLQWAIDNGCKALKLDTSSFLPTPGHDFRLVQMSNFPLDSRLIPLHPIINHIAP